MVGSSFESDLRRGGKKTSRWSGRHRLAMAGEGDFDSSSSGRIFAAVGRSHRAGAGSHKNLSIFDGLNDSKGFGSTRRQNGEDVFAHYSAKAESVWNVRNAD
jgi:hypothetical protein